jgi:Cof subfamily protein (haloacid dehalogenase superfamily)
VNDIALLVSDIDGTLVAPDKSLTPRASEAVRELGKAGVGFTLVSSRPPRGMAGLIRALDVRLPFAAFNGASLVGADMKLIRALRLSEAAARQTLDFLAARGIAAWVFADDAWFVTDDSGERVAHERHTVSFDPTVVSDFSAVIDRIDKIVGVSDDHPALAVAEADLSALLGGAASAVRSQTYYLDVTHPHADKGLAVRDLAAAVHVDLARTAVIGDMSNDVAMFKVAGLAIAMGQATDAVKAQAHAATGPNTADGFADAVERLILPRAAKPPVG